jgi:NCS1 family nucleobase:cation symporter-1
MDFYIVRRQRYNIAAVFDPDGEYGKMNLRALTAYFVGIAVEIPFMSTTFYTGPMVNRLGGADISWIIGVIVSGVLYLLLMRGATSSVTPITDESNKLSAVQN